MQNVRKAKIYFPNGDQIKNQTEREHLIRTLENKWEFNRNKSKGRTFQAKEQLAQKIWNYTNEKLVRFKIENSCVVWKDCFCKSGKREDGEDNVKCVLSLIGWEKLFMSLKFLFY